MVRADKVIELDQLCLFVALFGPAEAAGRCPFSRVDRKSSADGENDANDPEPTISRFLDFGLVTGQREFQDQL